MATFKTLGGKTIDIDTSSDVNEKITEANALNYKNHGSLAFAELPTLSSDVMGFVFNVTDDFTTDSRFVDGTGKKFNAGTNVVVTKVGDNYFYDVLASERDADDPDLATTEDIANITNGIWA